MGSDCRYWESTLLFEDRFVYLDRVPPQLIDNTQNKHQQVTPEKDLHKENLPRHKLSRNKDSLLKNDQLSKITGQNGHLLQVPTVKHLTHATKQGPTLTFMHTTDNSYTILLSNGQNY